MRYGSLSVETSYQPSGLPLSAAIRPASVIRPSTSVDVRAVQLALADEGHLDVPRHEDLRLDARRPRRRRPWRWRRCRPTAPRAPERRDARPVVTAADSPRALNELVGLSDSSLTNSRSSPNDSPEPARVDQRRPALAERQRLLAVEERHQLAIAPHVRRRGPRATPSSTRAPRRDRSGRAGERRRCRDAARRADRRQRRRTGRCIPGG